MAHKMNKKDRENIRLLEWGVQLNLTTWQFKIFHKIIDEVIRRTKKEEKL